MGPKLVTEDRIFQRLSWAFAASACINVALWSWASSFIHHTIPFARPPIEIERIILPRPVKVKPPLHKAPPKPPKPMIVPPKPQPTRAPKPSTPSPQGAHHRVLSAPVRQAANPTEPTVLPGGNAAPGADSGPETHGNARVAPPIEEPTHTPPPPQPTTPTQTPTPALPPPAPVPTPVPTPDPEPPKPAGPTTDAQPENQVLPDIPDDLKQGDYRSFVRVRVEVEADGSFTPVLKTSSGNLDIDQRVLDALKQWKWKPALQNGTPVKSVQLFKFEFEVN